MKDSDSLAQKWQAAWQKYEQGDSEATNLFERTTLEPFVASLVPLFVSLSIQFMVAPYASTPQLAWLADAEQDLCQAVLGRGELLAYPERVRKLITDIDFTVRMPEVKQRSY